MVPAVKAIDLKIRARTAAFAARKVAFAAGPQSGSLKRAGDFLAEVLADFRGQILAGYMPMRTEIDPLGAMAGHQGAVGVPVIIGAGQALQFRVWAQGCAMEMGAFGALIPQAGDWVVPQVLIVPLLAFDVRGYRLGYGGGFYDRTLQGLRANGPVTAIGFAFAAQEVDAVPIEDTDQRLDMIVTETGVRLPR